MDPRKWWGEDLPDSAGTYCQPNAARVVLRVQAVPVRARAESTRSALPPPAQHIVGDIVIVDGGG
jgi:hypothetical protein